MPLAPHRLRAHARSPYAAVAAAALALVVAPRTAAADPPPSGAPAPSPAPQAGPQASPAPQAGPQASPGALPAPTLPAPTPSAPTPPATSAPPPAAPFPPFAGVGASPGWMVVPPGYAAPYAWSPVPIQAPAPAVVLPPLPPRRYNSPRLFAGGVAAIAVGATTVLVGSYLVGSAPGRIEIYCDTPSFPCAYKTDAPRLTGGAIMMAAGTLVAVAGIPMWFIGARSVVDEKKAAALPIDVRVGAGTASLSGRF